MTETSLSAEETQEPLSTETQNKINKLATDVGSIPALNFIGGAALYSRHFNYKLPFEWVSELNTIINNSSASRGRIVNRFIEQVELREPTNEEKKLTNLLSQTQQFDRNQESRDVKRIESVARDAIAVIHGAADDVRNGDDRDEVVDWLERQADDLLSQLENEDGE